MRQRGLSILLLGLIAYQAVGFIGAFVVRQELHQASVRRHMKEKREAGNLETLRFCLEDPDFHTIRWIDGGKEFWYQRGLYDLHSLTRLPDGEIQLVCFRDHEEAEFLLHFARTYNNRDEQPTSAGIDLLFVAFVALPTAEITFLSGISPKFGCRNRNWVSHILEIAAPPPQTA